MSQERHFGALYKVRIELKSLDIYRHLKRERERERVMLKSMIIF